MKRMTDKRTLKDVKYLYERHPGAIPTVIEWLPQVKDGEERYTLYFYGKDDNMIEYYGFCGCACCKGSHRMTRVGSSWKRIIAYIKDNPGLSAFQ